MSAQPVLELCSRAPQPHHQAAGMSRVPGIQINAALLTSQYYTSRHLLWGSESGRLAETCHKLNPGLFNPTLARMSYPPAPETGCTFTHRSALYSGQGLLCRYCMTYTVDWCHQYSITTARTCHTWWLEPR